MSKYTLIALLFAVWPAMAQDTICLPRATYMEIYKGLKSDEYHRQKYSECLEIANSLNEIIQQQNDSLQFNIGRLQETEYELDHLNYELQQAVAKRPVPWYKSPWLWGGVGLLTGLILK